LGPHLQLSPHEHLPIRLQVYSPFSFHKKRQSNKQFKIEKGKMVVWLPWQQSLVMLIPLGSFYQLQ
jgi:hypothetical protein